jgi:hypothetical protein
LSIDHHERDPASLLQQLNAYSQRFADRLFRGHPEWRVLSRPDPEGFPPPGSLLVSVASRVAGRSLAIRTYGNQVTVEFGPPGWHEHFGSMASDERQAFEDALGFVDALLRDERVIIVRTVLGRFSWSRAIEASRIRPPRLGRTDIFSWTGRRDATLFPE